MKSYIGLTSNGIRVLKGVSRNTDARPILMLNEGEIRRLVIDATGWLDAAATVDTATITNNGVSATIALATPKATVTITGPAHKGYFTVTLTSSTGDVWIEDIHVRIPRRENINPTDYGNVAYV